MKFSVQVTQLPLKVVKGKNSKDGGEDKDKQSDGAARRLMGDEAPRILAIKS